MFAWTDERVTELKALWTEGLTASQIALKMGVTTRSAVIGKAHRLRLASRTDNTWKRPHERKPKVSKPKPVRLDRGGAGFAGFKRAKPQPLPPMPAEELSLYKQKILNLPPTVHGLEAFEPNCMCGYVHGEPSEQARCGRPKVEGSPSYCKEHVELCGQGITVAKRPTIWIRGNIEARVRGDVQNLREVEEFTAA